MAKILNKNDTKAIFPNYFTFKPIVFAVVSAGC